MFRNGLPQMNSKGSLNAIKKLLPMLRCSLIQANKAEKTSISSLLLATSHSRFTFETADAHLHDCPVVNNSAPLSSVLLASEDSTSPCQACISFAVHSFACDLFCNSFCLKCNASGTVTLPQELSSQIEEDFLSFKLFCRHVVSLSVSSMQPGRTWIVYNLNLKKISVLPLPCNEVPVTLGLWPLGVLDMTASTVCKEISSSMNLPEEVSKESLTCSWSRKSRTGSCRFATVDDGFPLSLRQLKELLAEKAVAQMDWNFVAKQLLLAKKYSTSEGRISAQTTWRTQMQKKAVDLALGRLRTVDNKEYSFTSKVEENESTLKNDPKRTESLLNASQSSSSMEDRKNETSEVNRTSSSTQDGAGKDDPQVILHKETGVWEYRYSNGNRSFVYPDGIKVYEEKNIKSTVYPDESVFFEYPDGICIRQTKNVRITTFPDGTKKEEAI